MQTAVAAKSRTAPPPRARKVITSVTAAAPVIVVAKAEPHPVYGRTPIGRDGCTLEVQNIHMLNVWHERACAAENKATPDTAEYDLLYNCKWAVFEAAFKVKITRPSEAAKLLLMILRQVTDGGSDVSILTVEQLQYVATLSAQVLQPLQPTKRVGALQRGRMLTRAGLLHRYHAFLVQELETLSWNLYGSRDYAMQYRPIDRAVTIRCGANFVGGKYKAGRRKSQPFFDAAALPKRARAVLKSLRIDTERNDDVPARKSSKRGSR